MMDGPQQREDLQKENALYFMVIRLFLPKSKGTTLNIEGMKQALGIRSPRLPGSSQVKLRRIELAKDLETVLHALTKKDNVLMERGGLYALKDDRLWNRDSMLPGNQFYTSKKYFPPVKKEDDKENTRSVKTTPVYGSSWMT